MKLGKPYHMIPKITKDKHRDHGSALDVEYLVRAGWFTRKEIVRCEHICPWCGLPRAIIDDDERWAKNGRRRKRPETMCWQDWDVRGCKLLDGYCEEEIARDMRAQIIALTARLASHTKR